MQTRRNRRYITTAKVFYFFLNYISDRFINANLTLFAQTQVGAENTRFEV